jgi:mediator of RNA polymerase II transcription subunit 7
MMAEESLISSLYPPPPAYYQFFTDENIDKVKQHKQHGIDLREEEKYLEFLKPPTQPDGETYRSFGNVWQVSFTLCCI